MENFPYHRQDDEAMCGPACVQMVLNYLQMTASNQMQQQLPRQSDLRIEADQREKPKQEPWIRYFSEAWATRPDELKSTLSQRQKEFNVSFESYYIGNTGDVPKKDQDGNPVKDKDGKQIFVPGYLSQLRKWINDPKSPTSPIVPVHGLFYYKQQLKGIIEAHGYTNIVTKIMKDYEAHWIVLFKHDKDGFLGHDPFFLTYGTENHSHQDKCKTVLIHINGRDSDIYDKVKIFPAINRVAVKWHPSPGGLPGGRIGWPPPTREVSPIQPPLLPPPPLPMVVYDEPVKAFDERDVLRQMSSFGLFADPPCGAYLRGSSFGKPRLVRRLDVIGRDYYLVPMLKPDGNSSAMVRVDAPTGMYLDSLYYSENPFLFDKSPARQTLMQVTIPQRLVALGKSDWLNPFAQQINEPSTEMVWLPCEQSVSAFFPFYVIKVPDTKKPTHRFLVRVDGKVFSQLTY